MSARPQASADGTLLETLIVEMRDEFTNQGMRDAGESRWPDPRWRNIQETVPGPRSSESMWRGIL